MACNAALISVMTPAGSHATFSPVAYLKTGTSMALYGSEMNATLTVWESALTESLEMKESLAYRMY